MYGTFIRFLKRNEKTGLSRFSVQLPDGTVAVLNGAVPRYAKHTPLFFRYKTGKTYENIKEYYNVSTSLCGYSFEASFHFLMSDEFKGIGQLAAKQLLENTGDDLFLYVRNNSSFSFPVKGISNNTLQKVYIKLRQMCQFEDLISFIYSIGGDYFQAYEMFLRQPDETICVVKDNPYILLDAKASYEVCENLAYKLGMEMCDKKRMHALVSYVFAVSRKNGHTRMTFHDLYIGCRRVENACGHYFTSPLFVAETLCLDGYYLEEADNELYIYNHTDYIAEEIIANSISRIKRSVMPYVHRCDIDDIEELCHISYSPRQRDAFSCLSEGICEITGGPGTGKTSLLNGILAKYERDYPNKKIVLCAPTGSASRRMQELTGKDAVTAHKLLNLRPFDNVFTAPRVEIDADLLAIDECSLLDTYIAAKLLSSVKSGCIVLLIGDKNQLPSVEAGNVFSDIGESGTVKVFTLDTIFRQNENNPIIENASRVIAGNANLVTDKRFVIKKLPDEDMIIKKLLDTVSALEQKNIEYKVFAPARKTKFKTGTINLNRAVQDKRNLGAEELFFGHYTFHVGDKVMFTSNNYEKNYFNGQDGTVSNIQIHGNMYYLSVAVENDVIRLTGSEIDDLELGYVITAHKSQGGECDNAIIIVPKEPKSLLKRKLFYVEITRAKKNVLILSEGDAYKTAISSYGEFERNTGLVGKLRKKEGLVD